MIASVCAAFFDCGRLKALTPFEIASVPVSAAEPEANAFRSTKTVTAPVPAGSACSTCAVGQLPSVQRAPPTTSSAYIESTKT